MARLPRLTLADQPHHVIQRGNNRQPIFVDSADRRYLLELLGESAAQFKVAFHAYVLMDNHFHLLATPADESGLPRWMQAIGRRYVRYFNQRHGRSGTLWEGRYRSTLLQPERYLMRCMVYIDLNPVRDGLVDDPAQYAWSSHGSYTGRTNERMLTPHPLYWTLGNTPFDREAAYSELVRSGLSRADCDQITQAVLHGWAMGDPAFLESLERVAKRRVSKSRPGRPRTKPGDNPSL
ncbi:MAG: transposase [Gammaproteobacteria bacterium]|nr:transposase [Gammaproteobacteria bacterium]MBU1440599.1 transposase [Gammaproteobacteria bacterium]MBU2287625.1 transposase [Gammaproteobacteria bacterium]MBU2410629.1 transposase [Gammaproteobacteria bacterium]